MESPVNLKSGKTKHTNIKQKTGTAAYSTGLPVFIILALLNINQSFAQNYNYEVGGRSAGISHASVALKDYWAGFNNQAALGYLEHPYAGFYFENKFQTKEFSMQAGTFAYPFKPGALSLSYRYFGFSQFYESKVGLGFGRKFTEKFAAGVQIDYLQTFIAEGTGSSQALAAEAGLMAEPVSNLIIGFQVFNPTPANKNKPFEDQIPTIFRTGFAYTLEKKATVLCEVQKDLNSSPLFKAGMELRVIESLDFRVGFSTAIEQYSVGLGYHFKNLLADLAFSHHQVLGFSPKISIGYEFN